MKLLVLLLFVGLLLAPCLQVSASELLLPQNREAFFSDETIEFAIVGLAAGTQSTLVITPVTAGLQIVKIPVTGDGTTVIISIPAYSLSPCAYTLSLDDKPAGKLTISSGIRQSSMYTSQSAKGWSNFTVSNAFAFGLYDRSGQPAIDVRNKKSGPMQSYEKAIATNQPALSYMYWTGYVTHKPFGSEKSWANADMMNTMRLLNFSTAQRLRRYDHAVLTIGALDEPGLSWGATPAGGMASGFPNWDEKPWYEKQGIKYTQDIANGSDADWMKYMNTRCQILGYNFNQARKDIKTCWPSSIFSTDAYALHAIMDGTDSLNQIPNDIPSSHVFFDWFGGPMSVTGQIQLEKAAIPQAKLAHAMNGQLSGVRGPQLPLYRQLMNGMLQGGIYSNWWLNTAGMTEADLAAVNTPAATIGPLFSASKLTGYDIAVLWGYTEIAMRQKLMASLESTKTSGKQITLMLPLPDGQEQKEFAMPSNAYEVGGTYTNAVLCAHQLLRRSGYPAQIIDERLLPKDELKKYKVLVIIGQTFPLSKEIMDSITKFTKSGGKVVVDQSTTIKIPGAIIAAIDYGANAIRQRDYKWNQKITAAGKDAIAASLANTIENTVNDFVRQGIPAIKTAMNNAKLSPVATTSEMDLSVDSQYVGDGQLITILNGHDAVPETAPNDKGFPRYNPAAYKASYKLSGVKKGNIVYVIEGTDWKKTRKLTTLNEDVTFEPGEMKIYLATPQEPKGLKTVAKFIGQQLDVTVTLDKVKMAWPITVVVNGPDSKPLYTVARSTDVTGIYNEKFPIGAVAIAGAYTINVNSLPGGFTSTASTTFTPATVVVKTISEKVRIFDNAAISNFLKAKPVIAIALGKQEMAPIAQKLATALTAKGIKTTVIAEDEVVTKAKYPRVWNPNAKLYTPEGDVKPVDITKEVKNNITITTKDDGAVIITDDKGKQFTNTPPLSMVTIGDGGYLQWNQNSEVAYEKGIVIYVNKDNQWQVQNSTVKSVPTTEEFKKKWAKPWSFCTPHVGGYQLPAQLPEAYTTNTHIIVMGNSTNSNVMRALQASEILPQTVDAKYPGPGKALLQFAWSPFATDKNVIVIGATDDAGLQAGITELIKMIK